MPRPKKPKTEEKSFNPETVAREQRKADDFNSIFERGSRVSVGAGSSHAGKSGLTMGPAKVVALVKAYVQVTGVGWVQVEHVEPGSPDAPSDGDSDADE